MKKVLVRDVHKARNVLCAAGAADHRIPDDVLCDPEITLVAEFMGGEQPATDYLLRALENGKTVVTANKVAVALNWHKLQAAAHGASCGSVLRSQRVRRDSHHQCADERLFRLIISPS